MDEKLHHEAPEKGPNTEQRDGDRLMREVREAKTIVQYAQERLSMGDVREARAIVRNALDADGSGVCRRASAKSFGDGLLRGAGWSAAAHDGRDGVWRGHSVPGLITPSRARSASSRK
jgi:hypothetical protein